ncbi:hypothetical protein [Halosolutus halophilus]|uniref:hypothetical protein n=1 Tax=Halosolutus halophilus TaxID=1552990 RepID=UPI00223502E2|nr:hypothetical protein [Halosolutus halophilus]
MEFDEERVALYETILDELSPPDGEAVSSAHFEKELELENAYQAIEDLIRLGELEIVNTNCGHVRVRLQKPVPSSTPSTRLEDFSENTVWLAYIVSGSSPRQRRAQRLFQNFEVGEEHLANISHTDSLAQVPGLEDVWCEEVKGLSTEYAILRKEYVFEQADDPWP